MSPGEDDLTAEDPMMRQLKYSLEEVGHQPTSRTHGRDPPHSSQVQGLSDRSMALAFYNPESIPIKALRAVHVDVKPAASKNGLSTSYWNVQKKYFVEKEQRQPTVTTYQISLAEWYVPHTQHLSSTLVY
ncbi:hypothetical protein SODALDRAFT_359010 [Sodiomyces alkalinus F11]|uniref:Uncharacterized protein n=1 Tax=Sodiomyces alkalinus (strain CBS 110278 / VKM F-3762 / F11) TaxID=1314773 RepID=A0A3N2PX84_SODAK|nr:hypothetical protein SODALDRAFT_359010 [Sodiomyces alkalinus F11]ROT39143.1 hypothetical protein SODALDRAFT_359010 [Sodiomyces alkalinus F11]